MRWAATEADFERTWTHLCRYAKLKNLDDFVNYFTKFYIPRKDKWAAAYDPLQDSWGTLTNNLLEVRHICE